MSEIKDNLDCESTIDRDDVKRKDEVISHFQPGGELENHSRSERSGRDFNLESEPCERKKKTRRGKPKEKNPYNKEVSDIRGKSSNRQKNVSRFAQRQPVAPYNTNQFLMEDHGDVQDIDEKLNTAPTTSSLGINQRPPRVRDPSFTSADSDDFYSSPEDEEEFLTKEFSNTYKDLHVETLGSMSKTELIQQVLQLEEKLDMVEKRIGGGKSKNDVKEQPARCNLSTVENDVEYANKIKQFQQEISKLLLEKEKLQIENDRLRRRNRSSSVSSVDSESDSSTSSPSSVSDLSDREELMCSHEESNLEQDVNSPIIGDGCIGENEVVMVEHQSFT